MARKLLPDADQHAGRSARMPAAALSATGKKQESAPIAIFEPEPDAEPHDHHREEDDLRRRPEIVEIAPRRRCEQEPVGAEQDADREAREPADQQAPMPISAAVTPRCQ